jgi:hypothetical protein
MIIIKIISEIDIPFVSPNKYDAIDYRNESPSICSTSSDLTFLGYASFIVRYNDYKRIKYLFNYSIDLFNLVFEKKGLSS